MGIQYVWAYMKRLVQLMYLAPRFDAVWILRELAPIGPPFLERLVFRLNRSVILDIDDAIFLRDKASKEFIHNHLRDFSKFEKIADQYQLVVCGNRFLADYFINLGARVEIIPTVVNSQKYSMTKHTNSHRPRLGWIGTPSNYIHLNLIKRPILRLARELDVQLVIIGLTRRLSWGFEGINYVSWELSKELSYFGMFDIGLMPVLDFEFTKGKCAFKIIQYMAAGLPVVASPVGANAQVVGHGVNGFLANSGVEWEDCLRDLLTDPDLRKRMGNHGKQTVREHFSLEVWGERYSDIFKKNT